MGYEEVEEENCSEGGCEEAEGVACVGFCEILEGGAETWHWRG